MTEVVETRAEVPFEDLLPERNLGVGYVVPNEDIGIWRKLTSGLRLNRAGGICSGGEVGFFSLLPSVRKELILVDHNYHSLRYAMIKYLLLKKHGFEGCLALFNDHERLKEEVKACKDVCPKAIRTAGRGTEDYHTDPEDGYGGANSFFGARILKACHTGDGWTKGTQMCDSWARLSPYVRRQAVRKLDKVKFIHGDFVALKDHGPFDLFYVSNASEGGNGNLNHKNRDDIAALVKDGGYVLSSTEQRPARAMRDYSKPITKRDSYGYTYKDYEIIEPEPEKHTWDLVEVSPFVDAGMPRWKYHLYRITHIKEGSNGTPQAVAARTRCEAGDNPQAGRCR